MKDILELLAELAGKYPNLQWPLIFLICFLIVLAWEVLKTLLPKAISSLTSVIHRRYTLANAQASQEKSVRDFMAHKLQFYWLPCVQSISKYRISVPLSDIYYPLRFQFYGEQREYTSSIERILVETKAFAVVGPPGSGKSTLMSRLAIAYAEDSVEAMLGIKESRLPLFFPLRDLPVEPKSIDRVLTQYLQNAGCSIDDDFIRDQLKKKRCIVLLDGLDETGDEARRREVVEWIVKAISAFPKNTFIVSCRNTEWNQVSIPNMPCAYILDLSHEEIAGIIRKWENHLKEKAGTPILDEGLSQRILQPENRDLRLLAKNPLLLTIMVILHFNGIGIPSRKVEVYSVFIRTLIGEWDEGKGLKATGTELSVDRRLRFLQRLSLFLLQNESLGERINLGIDQIASFAEKNLQDIFGEDVKTREFLDSIASRSGLLYKTGENEYLFSSRVFLEFLAARELADKRDYNTVIKHVIQEEWFETNIQFATLLPDTVEFAEILNEVPERNDLYYRVIVHLLLDTVLSNAEIREKILETINDYVLKSISTGQINIELIRDAYAITPADWLGLLYSELINSDSSVEPEYICQALASLEDLEALKCLRDALKVVMPDVKVEITKSLKHSTLTESINMLWELIVDADEVYEVAVDSLSSKGEAVIQSCKRFLSDTSSSELRKKAAVSVLCKIDNSLVIPYLIETSSIVTPTIYYFIVEQLHRTYLSQHKLQDAQRVLDMATSPKSFYATYFKRLLDVIFSFVELIVSAPLLMVISILIRLDSPGPVFYRQVRIGKNGRPFEFITFRTTTVDAEATQTIWTILDDPRVTRVGRFLRRFSLDQLPFIVSVLRGEMSLIGPRPQRAAFYSEMTETIPFYNSRMNVRPGATGYAQVNYIYGAPIEDEFIHDLYYASHCSMLLDVKIILKTMWVTLTGERFRE